MMKTRTKRAPLHIYLPFIHDAQTDAVGLLRFFFLHNDEDGEMEDIVCEIWISLQGIPKVTAHCCLLCAS